MGLLLKIAVWCLAIQYFLPKPVNAYPLPWSGDSKTDVDDSKFDYNYFGSSCKSDDPQCAAPPRVHYNEDAVRPTSSPWYSPEFFLESLSLHSIIALLIVAVSTLVVLWVYTLHFLCLIPVRLVRRYLIRHGSIDSASHDILDNLRKRLDATEKERDEIKTELEHVRDVSCVDGKSFEGNGMTSRVTSQSCLSEMTGSKQFDTKADYVRKCRYLARKLKDSESRIETMKEQVEMAKGIKTEFDGLLETRTELGRQNVALTREKREAKQRVASLQVELKAAKKQLDLSNDQNALLLKQAELLNLNLKIAVRDKKTVRNQLKQQTDEVDDMREELNRVNEENRSLRKKIQEMGRILGLDDEEGEKGTRQAPILVNLVTNSNSSQLNLDEKEEIKYDNETMGDTTETVENKAIVGDFNIPEPSAPMSAEAQDIEQSLLNLERSVEKNLKLRKYAKSLITGTGSSSKDPMDNFIMNIRSEIQTDETSYEGYENRLKLSEESDIDPNLREPSSECPYKTIIHDTNFSSPSSLSDISSQGSVHSDSKSNRSSDKNSICCFDSSCSLCSLPGCTRSHVSCTDIHCLATMSSCSLPDGKDHLAKVVDRQESRTSIFRQTDEGNNESGYVRQPPARRSSGIERLADIFGNGPIGEGGAWNMTGLEGALLGRAMRSSESVFVNAGSQVFNPNRGEKGDGFSRSDVSTGGNSTSSTGSVVSLPSMRRSSNVAVDPTSTTESVTNKISCFARNDETATSGANSSAAFKRFMEQMKGVTEDPRLGDEDPVFDEAGDQGNCDSLCV